MTRSRAREEAGSLDAHAEAGHALAQFKLGVFAAHGRGVAQDWFMASEWYTAAAEAGVADAQFALGRLYATGRGVAKSHERACFWYSRGAQQGHGKAQFNLALRYTQGSGVCGTRCGRRTGSGRLLAAVSSARAAK